MVNYGPLVGHPAPRGHPRLSHPAQRTHPTKGPHVTRMQSSFSRPDLTGGGVTVTPGITAQNTTQNQAATAGERDTAPTATGGSVGSGTPMKADPLVQPALANTALVGGFGGPGGVFRQMSPAAGRAGRMF